MQFMMALPEKSLEIESVEELAKAADFIIKNAGENKVLAFYGEMGAGKTTLIKAICKKLDVVSIVTSPTFSIVNEYTSKLGEKFYHFDFYRIKDIREAYDLGYETYFFSGNYCFIEWPEMIASLLDFPCCKIQITVSGKKRIVTLRA